MVHRGDLMKADGSCTTIAIKTIKCMYLCTLYKARTKKILFVNLVITLNSVRNLVAESSIMKKMDHPNVLSLLGVCVDTDDEDMLKLILPFMGHGDLKKFLIRSRKDPSNVEQLPSVCPYYTMFLTK